MDTNLEEFHTPNKTFFFPFSVVSNNSHCLIFAE